MNFGRPQMAKNKVHAWRVARRGGHQTALLRVAMYVCVSLLRLMSCILRRCFVTLRSGTVISPLASIRVDIVQTFQNIVPRNLRLRVWSGCRVKLE